MPTVEPRSTEAPPAGSWLITSPAGTLGSLAVVTAGTRPAPVMAVSAAVWDRATTLGTMTCTGGGLLVPLHSTMA